VGPSSQLTSQRIRRIGWSWDPGVRDPEPAFLKSLWTRGRRRNKPVAQAGPTWDPGRRRNRPSLYVIGVTILGCIPPVIWYRPGYVISGADFNQPFSPISTFLTSWSGWLNAAGTGGRPSLQYLPIDIPYYALLAIFQTIGIPRGASEIILFAAILSSSGLAMWLLLSRTLGSEVGAFAGAVVYMFNPFVLIEWHDGNPIELIAYGIGPLIVLLLDMLLKDARIRPRFWIYVFVSALMLGTPSSNPMATVGFVIVPMTIWAAVNLTRQRHLLLDYRVILCRLCGLIGITIGANLWWLIPTGLHASSVVSALNQQSNSTSPIELITPVNFLDLVRGLGFWGWRQGFQGQLYFPFEPSYNGAVMILLTLIPVEVALLAALVRRAIAPIVAWAGIACSLVGLFLSAGFHGPLHLYLWVYRHIPAAGSLRSPWERFAGLWWFGLALLIGLAAASLDAWTKRTHTTGQLSRGAVPNLHRSTRVGAMSRLLLALAAAGVMVGISYPIFGNFLGTVYSYGSGTAPEYYGLSAPRYVASFVRAAVRPNCEIFFPQWEESAYVTFPWYRGGSDVFQQLLKCRVLAGDTNPTNDGQRLVDLIDEAMLDGVQPTLLVNFLQSLGVTDILVPFDYDYSLYGEGPSPSASTVYFRDDSSLLLRNFGPWVDFELPKPPATGQGLKSPMVIAVKSMSSLPITAFEALLGSEFSNGAGASLLDVPSLSRSLPLASAVESSDWTPLSTDELAGILPSEQLDRIQRQPRHAVGAIGLIGNNAIAFRIQGVGFLVSSIAFDSGWSLTLTPIGSSSSAIAHHVEVNGFANGWVIAGDGRYSAVLTYQPVRLIRDGVVLTLLTFLSVISFAGIRVVQQRIRVSNPGEPR